jgi:hypothetical protein
MVLPGATKVVDVASEYPALICARASFPKARLSKTHSERQMRTLIDISMFFSLDRRKCPFLVATCPSDRTVVAAQTRKLLVKAVSEIHAIGNL